MKQHYLKKNNSRFSPSSAVLTISIMYVATIFSDIFICSPFLKSGADKNDL